MPFLLTFCLYFTSFFPLWIAILFIDIKSILENSDFVITEWISVIVIAFLLIVSLCVLISTVSGAKRDLQTLQEYELVEANKQKSITAEFVLAYIVPLIAFDFTKWDGALLFAIIFSILSILCIKHNYISVNPALELTKYRYFSCELLDNGNGVERVVISKESLPSMVGKRILIRKINNEYAIHVKR